MRSLLQRVEPAPAAVRPFLTHTNLPITLQICPCAYRPLIGVEGGGGCVAIARARSRRGLGCDASPGKSEAACDRLDEMGLICCLERLKVAVSRVV